MSVEVLHIDSSALRGNPLGDPHHRKLHVVVPDDVGQIEPVPCIWWLAGYAGVSRAMLSHDPWQEGLEERIERLRRENRIGRAIVALPDTFTKYGGCQYLSSPAAGDYERHLFDELYPLVSERYHVSAHAIAGKSSGGYGAIVHAMRRPDLFSAVACHSGDLGFEMSLVPEIPKLMNAIRDAGSLEAFVAAFEATARKKEGRWFGPIFVLAMCAAYSPDPSQPLGVALPFDLDNGVLDHDVLERWYAWDPIRLIDRAECQAALKKMKLVYLDCGRQDEHHLHWGARAFAAKLKTYGIPHVHEEFDGGHRSTSHRLDVSLPMLYAALTS
jgi:enterochelin esterase family protein